MSEMRSKGTPVQLSSKLAAKEGRVHAADIRYGNISLEYLDLVSPREFLSCPDMKKAMHVASRKIRLFAHHPASR
jgi:hypothetical protein